MKINKFLLCSVVFIMFTGTIIIGGCKNKDKEIVLSENVAKDIQVEENEIEKYINEGNKFLEEKKYVEARKSYEAAITKGKNDKQIYTDIKDKYIKKNRYDDAYYIIKLAIDNKVDTENMQKILANIRGKMEGVELFYDIYEDDLSFDLPEEVEIIIDNNKIKDYVLWEKSKIDILNQPGQYSYNGVTKEYGRNVHVTLNIKENVYDSRMGYVKNIYTDNNIIYISFDEVEFYTGEDALVEAKKDNKAIKEEDGTYIVYDDYYIRNSVVETKVYEVSKNVAINLLAYEVNQDNNTIDFQTVNYDTFKKHIDKYKKDASTERALLCKVDMKNNIVALISRQYTP
ncbi:tetratricopeptide repeat protein [Clostridium sp. UBA7503]|uniref:tetratricopeptide repeat protein n=1 Tax=Clostridium sp. UBA7503 TaxID=1946377 RepID=UPI003217FC02